VNELTSSRQDVSVLKGALVDQLKRSGCILSPGVETAFHAVPRHLFLPDTPLEEAYADRAIPVKLDENGQWISSSSQPAMMAIMLEQLDLAPGHRVLEIGAGSGYNAALIAHIVGQAGQVTSIDIDQDLVDAARTHLVAAGFERVRAMCADGGFGYREAAPYDRVILSVGAPDILPAWIEQLKPDGRLVLPLSIVQMQHSIAFERSRDYLISRSARDCGFMKLRGAFAEAPVERLSLGPEPGLTIENSQQLLLDAGQAYAWLTGPGRDWDTGLEVTVREALTGLAMWLSLHELEVVALVARGDLVSRNIVPPLVGYTGVDSEDQSVSTVVLMRESGMAALMRPPGQAVPLADAYSTDAFTSPFRLFVRAFGPDESAAVRLVEEVRAWDTAGRPSTENLRVKVYPKYVDYAPAEGEYLVEKEWTRMALDWPASG
jgi:protein-L-isoaspartate(D-aspartate) O-methyltransferase